MWGGGAGGWAYKEVMSTEEMVELGSKVSIVGSDWADLISQSPTKKAPATFT